jgi:hypothetical protein
LSDLFFTAKLVAHVEQVPFWGILPHEVIALCTSISFHEIHIVAFLLFYWHDTVRMYSATNHLWGWVAITKVRAAIIAVVVIIELMDVACGIAFAVYVDVYRYKLFVWSAYTVLAAAGYAFALNNQLVVYKLVNPESSDSGKLIRTVSILIHSFSSFLSNFCMLE